MRPTTTAGNRRTPLPPGEIHVWKANLDAGWPGAAGLPRDERARAGEMGAAARARWVAARWALRGALARYLAQEPGAIELRRGERGKPMLASPRTSLRFNLSHSGQLALIAIGAEREVGVDVERIRPRRNLPALTRRALDPTQAARVESTPERGRLAAFHAAWARREAAAKCTGAGLAAALPEAALTVLDLHVEPGYAAALAIAGEGAPTLRHLTIAPDPN